MARESAYRSKKKQEQNSNDRMEIDLEKENFSDVSKSQSQSSSSKSSKELKKQKNKEKMESAGFSIMLQNFTIYSIYRKLLLLAILSTITLVFYVVGLFYLTDEEVEPRYIPVAQSGKVFKEHPLNTPFVQDGDIIKNALDVTNILYTFDYKNWKGDQQILRASPYFENDAWNDFQRSLIASKNMETVIDGKRIVSVSITDNAKIKSRVNPNNNIFEWEVTVPVIIEYESPFKDKGILKQIGNAEFRYRRTSLESNPRQFHIVRYRFEPTR